MLKDAVRDMKKCRSLNELASFWEKNVEKWSTMDESDCRRLIQVKNELKEKLRMFEQWTEWYEERSAIMQFEGKAERQDANQQAKDNLWECLKFSKALL